MRGACCLFVAMAVGLVGTFLVSHSGATDVLSQEKAIIDLVVDAADRICIEVPLNSKQNKTKISGKAKAELNRIFQKVIAAGVDVDAAYEVKETQGFLQDHLHEIARDNLECRQMVADHLLEKWGLAVTTREKATHLMHSRSTPETEGNTAPCQVIDNDVNFSDLEAGDDCPGLGAGNMIRVNKYVQRAGLSNNGTQPVTIQVVGFSQEIPYSLNIVATANFAYGKVKSIRLVGASGVSTTTDITPHKVNFGNGSENLKSSGFKPRQLNRLCFAVNPDHVRLYINGKFVQRSDAALAGLRRVEFDGIHRHDALFSISASPDADCTAAQEAIQIYSKTLQGIHPAVLIRFCIAASWMEAMLLLQRLQVSLADNTELNEFIELVHRGAAILAQ